MHKDSTVSTQNRVAPLTFEEQTQFAFDFMGLQFHFLWKWLESHPEESFPEALRKRIDLCRKTDPAPKHFDIASMDHNRPSWLEIQEDLTRIYESCKQKGTAADFEKAALKRVEKDLRRFVELTYGSKVKMAEYQCGSLKYDQPKPETPQLVNFHIANAIAPKSIFEDKQHLKDCFFCLMDQTEQKYSADTLTTGTWLNSCPKWLSYFPQEWMDNMEPENKDVHWHYGFWGQFISARGDLNRKYANHLRATGEFLFWMRTSRCSFKAMRKHLDTIS